MKKGCHMGGLKRASQSYSTQSYSHTVIQSYSHTVIQSYCTVQSYYNHAVMHAGTTTIARELVSAAKPRDRRECMKV
jgi:hypothetical protein